MQVCAKLYKLFNPAFTFKIFSFSLRSFLQIEQLKGAWWPRYTCKVEIGEPLLWLFKTGWTYWWKKIEERNVERRLQLFLHIPRSSAKKLYVSHQSRQRSPSDMETALAIVRSTGESKIDYLSRFILSLSSPGFCNLGFRQTCQAASMVIPT